MGVWKWVRCAAAVAALLPRVKVRGVLLFVSLAKNEFYFHDKT
jgi:hypothetical protein